ncbi:MAG: hypothetical protein QOE79_2067 [Sphingomonadales bacterium]|nr:hypothetical protein [Sphingomonadales bacterium]MEA3049343.1 hypothetical protein [Sphingomonadales bacterium]
MATAHSAPRAVTVVLPHGNIGSIDHVHRIVASALGKLGCGGCFSGFDIRFSPGDLVVNPKTFDVGPMGG